MSNPNLNWDQERGHTSPTVICPRCELPMEAGDHKLLESCIKVLKGRVRALNLQGRGTQRLIRAVVAGMDYNPGHSDLDDEQPITVRMTLGDYRLACRMREPLPSEFRVTFLAEDGLRYTLGNQGVLSLEAAAKIVRDCNDEEPKAEARVEQLVGSDWKEVLCDQISW